MKHKLRFIFVWLFCPDLAAKQLAQLEDEVDELQAEAARLKRVNTILRRRLDDLYQQPNEGTRN